MQCLIQLCQKFPTVLTRASTIPQKTHQNFYEFYAHQIFIKKMVGYRKKFKILGQSQPEAGKA